MENQEKKKMSKDIKVFIVIVSVVLLIIAGAVVYLLKPKDVAIINNNKITKEEFTYYYTQNLQYILQLNTSGQDTETFLNTSYGDGTVLDMVKAQAMSQATQVEVILQEAKKEGFKVDAQVLADAWSDMEATIDQNSKTYGVTTDEVCQQAFGVNYKQVKAIYQDYITTMEYSKAKIAEVPVDEATLTAYYEENKDSFNYNSVRHILINCAADAEESVVAEKSKTAQDLLDRINKGEDIATLAQEFSEDGGSKDNGGAYDVKKGQMVEEFEEWTFSHKIGDTGVVRTDYGFHVMKLDGITDNFEALRDAVTSVYQTNQYQTKIEEIFNSPEYEVKLKEGYAEF